MGTFETTSTMASLQNSSLDNDKLFKNGTDALNMSRSSNYIPDITLWSVYAIIHPIISCIGIFINGFTMYIMHSKSRWTIYEWTFYIICIVDVVVILGAGLYNSIQLLVLIQYPFVLTPLLSTLLGLTYIPLFVSKYLTIFLSFERFVAVFIPLEIKTFWSIRKVSISILFFASLTIFVGIGTQFNVLVVSNNTLRMVKTPFAEENKAFAGIYDVIHLVLANIPIPCVVLLSVMTVYMIWTNHKKRLSMTLSQQLKITYVHRVSKRLMAVSTLFILTNLPGTILLFVVMFRRVRPEENLLVNEVVKVLSLMNSVLNGLVYILVAEEFKMKMRKMCCKPLSRDESNFSVTRSIRA